MNPASAILICMLAPLVGAMLCLAAGSRGRAAAVIAIVTTLLSTAASVVLVVAFRGGALPVIHLGSWPAPHGIALAADGLSALMLAVSNLITLAVAVYSWHGLPDFFRRRRFHPLLLTLLLGVNGAFLTTDLFNLYVWFEVLLLSSFVMMSSVPGRKARGGAWRYVLLNLLSSLMFLSAAGLLYGKAGTLNMAHLASLLRESDDAFLLNSSAALLFAAFAIKSALVPFAFWLPASYPHAPIAVSALFAGLLTKVGVYSFFRCFGMVFADGESFAHREILLPVAIATMVIGVLGAVGQSDMRRILSFHIISQVGYMLLALALFTPLALAAGLFYVVHHIVVKSNLFLTAGLVERISGSSDLARTGGMMRSAPAVTAAFAVAALSLAGLPPLSGFWAKFSLLAASLDSASYFSAAAILLVGLLTLFSMLKIWTAVFWGEPKPVVRTAAPASMIGPAVGLALVTVVIGLAAQPLFSLAEMAAASLLDPTPYIDAVLGNAAMQAPPTVALEP
jgi:multicomponent Na+:H+ antiporter subunit D